MKLKKSLRNRHIRKVLQRKKTARKIVLDYFGRPGCAVMKELVDQLARRQSQALLGVEYDAHEVRILFG